METRSAHVSDFPPKAESVPESVQRYLAQVGDAAWPCIVAVSGGPDSVALARAFAALEVPIIVAHLNHQLRGAESDGDEAFVEKFARELSQQSRSSVAFRATRIAIAELARSRRANLEATARRERYRWLAELARHEGFRRVATGHTANDQAETVIHRLLRGTGVDGLRGIAPRRTLRDGVELLRPMLEVRRLDVYAYLNSLHQEFRVDSSNNDSRMTRNRIRRTLLPRLEAVDPNVVTRLCQVANEATNVHQCDEHTARRILAAAERPRAGDVVILDRKSLTEASSDQLTKVFRFLFRRESWPTGQMNMEAWTRIARLASGWGTAIDLPAGVRARCKGPVLQLWRMPSATRPVESAIEHMRPRR
jgi:tRNA(Ile)-lysidine synthase